MPEVAPRLYPRTGVAFVPINGLPGCDVAVVRRRDAPRTAVNFAKIARRTIEAAAQVLAPGPPVRRAVRCTDSPWLRALLTNASSRDPGRRTWIEPRLSERRR